MFCIKNIKISWVICFTIAIVQLVNITSIANILFDYHVATASELATNSEIATSSNIASDSELTPLDPNNHKKIVREYKSRYPDYQKQAYDDFLDNVKNQRNYFDVGTSVTFFSNYNKNLLIGHSGAVFFGYTMGAEKLLEYGYDVVSLGGLLDEDIRIALDNLNKKYDNIIIFGSTNDLNLRASFSIDYLDESYYTGLYEMLERSKNHLKRDSGQVVFIKLKPMVLGLDHTDPKYVNDFNYMVDRVNESVDTFGYKVYDIPFDTSSKYSSHYIHFDNIKVFEQIIKDIEFLYYNK